MVGVGQRFTLRHGSGVTSRGTVISINEAKAQLACDDGTFGTANLTQVYPEGFCFECTRQNVAEAAFCGGCGAGLSEAWEDSAKTLPEKRPNFHAQSAKPDNYVNKSSNQPPPPKTPSKTAPLPMHPAATPSRHTFAPKPSTATTPKPLAPKSASGSAAHPFAPKPSPSPATTGPKHSFAPKSFKQTLDRG